MECAVDGLVRTAQRQVVEATRSLHVRLRLRQARCEAPPRAAQRPRIRKLTRRDAHPFRARARLGIGGLARQFEGIFRRAFASRLFPPHIVSELGIPHVRGMLLYGPPGCGKTLIARQIGKVLNAREPKIVNGPEVLDKYVGGSEEKIRALFADAEEEQANAGDESMLHIVIFDEVRWRTMGGRDGAGC